MNGVRGFFSAIGVQFSVKLLFFVVLLCVFGNGMGVTRWESHGNANKS